MKRIYDYLNEGLFDDDGDITIEALMHRAGEIRSKYYERINNLCNVHGYEKPSRYIKGCYYIVVTLTGRFLHIEAFDTADNCVYMIQQLGPSGKLTASSEHVNPDSMREYITRTARNRTSALDDSIIRVCDKTDVIYDAIVKYVREHEK